MTVNTATGEITTELTAEQARAITTRIKEAAESIWSLLLEAHERNAWLVLGYRTWNDYVQVEFNMSKQHSFRLLDQARVIREIGSVMPESPTGDFISEREARDIKPVLAEVKAEIADAVKDVPDDQPDVVAEKVHEVIDRTRSKIAAARPRVAPVTAEPSVPAPAIGDMNRDARATPSYIAGKAFDSLILAKKQIAQAGGIPRIIADLEGPDGQAQAENWLPAIEAVRDLLDEWATRLQRKSSSLRRVK